MLHHIAVVCVCVCGVSAVSLLFAVCCCLRCLLLLPTEDRPDLSFSLLSPSMLLSTLLGPLTASVHLLTLLWLAGVVLWLHFARLDTETRTTVGAATTS